MKNFLIICAFLCLSLGSTLHAQEDDLNVKDLNSYPNWLQDENKAEGYVFFLISAEWCVPCKILEKQLMEHYMAGAVVYVDWDKHNSAARFFNPGGSVPFLVRYKLHKVNGEWKIFERTPCPDRNYLDFIRTKWPSPQAH